MKSFLFMCFTSIALLMGSCAQSKTSNISEQKKSEKMELSKKEKVVALLNSKMVTM